MEHDPTNGSNDLGPAGTPADERTVPNIPQVSPDGSSRRNFLKAAVVASAAVAAAGGAAGVALVSGGNRAPLLQPVAFSNCNPQCSGAGDPCSACLTNSGPAGRLTSITVKTSNGNSTPGDFLFWVTNTTAQIGYYKLSVSVSGSPAPTSGNSASTGITGATSPWQFPNTSNDVYVNTFTTVALNSPMACPDKGTNSSYGGGSYGTKCTTAETTPCQGYFQFDGLTTGSSPLNSDNSGKGFYLAAAGAIQFALHITYSGGALTSSPTTFTFTFTLQYSKDGSSYTNICPSDTYTLTATAS